MSVMNDEMSSRCRVDVNDEWWDAAAFFIQDDEFVYSPFKNSTCLAPTENVANAYVRHRVVRMGQMTFWNLFFQRMGSRYLAQRWGLDAQLSVVFLSHAAQNYVCWCVVVACSNKHTCICFLVTCMKHTRICFLVTCMKHTSAGVWCFVLWFKNGGL